MSEPRRRLLLVEDDLDLCATIADVLMDAGFEVMRAENGNVALEKLHSGADPDVIVLDLMMPQMNGWQFRVAQKSDPRFVSTPVIVISANHSAHARAIDADFHLPKPFPLQSLVGAVERAISLRDRRQAATSHVHSDRMASIWTLAAGLAHEINNPLTGLIGNLEMARRLVSSTNEPAPTRLESCLANASDAALQIAHVVKDAATLATTDEPRIPIDPCEVLDSALRMLSSELQAVAELESQHEAVPLVRATPGRLLQVFLNLLANAIQSFRPDQRGLIRTRTFTSDDGDAVIEISDDGSGIPSDQLGSIFEPFFTTKAPGKGTGLGLSISHEIVSTMGGRITVDSTFFEGATFRVYLPGTDRSVSGTHRVDPTLQTHKRAKLRLLVVEDDEVVVKALAQLLLGHELTVEPDIRGARERVLSGERFDAVVCDLNLPDGSGAELHIAITQYRPELSDRFVLMAGEALTRADAEFVKRLGERAVSKPFEPRQLERAVRAAAAASEPT